MIVISPAKNLDNNAPWSKDTTDIRFPEKTQKLINVLKKKKKTELQNLMGISEKLAEENMRRYKAFKLPLTEANSRPAIHFFMGDGYRGMEVTNWGKRDHNYAQKNLRILSGLYGLLRPMDKMHAYRLEMGTSLKNGKHNSLYSFWGNDITELLLNDLEENKSKFVLNLASKEYWKSVDVKQIQVPIIEFHFREKRDGKYKFISYNAKRARGLMASFIIQNKIKSLSKVKGFNSEDYMYNDELSDSTNFFFTR